MQKDLFGIRNGLMHGRSREQIEASIQERVPDFEFAKAVDFAGRNAFMRYLTPSASSKASLSD
jgi:hypothetical protein